MNATSLPHVVLVLTDQQSVWTLSLYHRALGTHHASYADFPSSSTAPLQTPSRSATLTCERDAERRKCARSCGACE